jgi:hypothetical protein
MWFSNSVSVGNVLLQRLHFKWLSDLPPKIFLNDSVIPIQMIICRKSNNTSSYGYSCYYYINHCQWMNRKIKNPSCSRYGNAEQDNWTYNWLAVDSYRSCNWNGSHSPYIAFSFLNTWTHSPESKYLLWYLIGRAPSFISRLQQVHIAFMYIKVHNGFYTVELQCVILQLVSINIKRS